MRNSGSMDSALATKLNLTQQDLTTELLSEKLSSANNLLTEISLAMNDIVDASYLSRFPMLRKINIMRNPLQDIKWVEKLSALEELEISTTEVSDLTPITNLKNLRKLSVSNTKIKDISPIASCKNLEILYLSDNDLPDDLSALCGLSKLKELHISGIDKLTPKTLLSLISLPFLEILEVDDEFRSTKNYIMMLIRENSSAIQRLSELFSRTGFLKSQQTITEINFPSEELKQKLNQQIEELTKPIKEISDVASKEKMAALILGTVVTVLGTIISPPSNSTPAKKY